MLHFRMHRVISGKGGAGQLSNGSGRVLLAVRLSVNDPRLKYDPLCGDKASAISISSGLQQGIGQPFRFFEHNDVAVVFDSTP
jgi:hypothetical protein